MTARTTRARLVLAVLLLLPLAPGTAAAQEVPAPAPAPAPAVLGLTASATTVTAGRAVTLTVAAKDGSGGPLVAETVDVLSRQGGTTTVMRVAQVITDASGTATARWTPRVSAEYTLRLASGAAATTARRIVHVQPVLTAALSPSSVGLGGASVLRGRLTPAYAGARLQVQRRSPDGSWRAVTVVATNGAGDYAWTVRPGVGSYVLRSVLPGTMAHLGATSSPSVLTVTALPAAGLRSGASGAAVLALERALAAQKADVGRIDGVFDNDLRHALVAFQKSQDLPRTGVYDTTTRSRLTSPRVVRLRYPAAGRAVEVDLARQVLYLSTGGALQRIVDVSSGNGALYTVDGITSRAITPTGRFRVTRKIDGVRTSRLGVLYRPTYFVGGYAIHGSPSVPPYPASHGCIRVTNRAQDRLYPLMAVGTPVSVYR